MHFVGNRAIILGDGRPELQLVYSPGYTALSAFLPIVFLLIAFTIIEFRQPGEKAFWPCLVLSSFIVGLAFTGMHYVGNFGVSNYDLSNKAAFIVGAGAFAIAASLTALSLFFYFKEKWVNSFWRRIACASVLASAVPVLHWVATVGTTYRLKAEGEDKTYSRNVNLIVAIICVSSDFRMLSMPRAYFILRDCLHALYASSLQSSHKDANDSLPIEHSMLYWHLRPSIQREDFS
jgi:NO-binding membrane sensor protein with MHYT domain